MAIIKKQKTCVSENVEESNPCASLVEMSNGAAALENNMAIPNKRIFFLLYIYYFFSKFTIESKYCPSHFLQWKIEDQND